MARGRPKGSKNKSKNEMVQLSVTNIELKKEVKIKDIELEKNNITIVSKDVERGSTSSTQKRNMKKGMSIQKPIKATIIRTKRTQEEKDSGLTLEMKKQGYTLEDLQNGDVAVKCNKFLENDIVKYKKHGYGTVICKVIETYGCMLKVIDNHNHIFDTQAENWELVKLENKK